MTEDKKRGRRIVLGFFAAFAIPAGITLWMFYEPIPQHDLTVGNMAVTRRRVLEFVQANKRLPKDLTELPPMPAGYDPAYVDGAGVGFGYSADDQGVVTLRSIEKDGRAGGMGVDEVVGVFATRSGSDGWVLPDSRVWIRQPGAP